METHHVKKIDFSQPYGLTVIVGGTNLRFCLSQTTVEPRIFSINWDELKKELPARPPEEMKDRVLSLAFKKFLEDLKTREEQSCEDFNLTNLKVVNISVAGPVIGEGFDARVTTTNTGVEMVAEPIAETFLGILEDHSKSMRLHFVRPSEVNVLNDAAAGVIGEQVCGGLQGAEHGVYVILGTGLGGMGLVDQKVATLYSELGHRIILDESGTPTDFLNGDRLGEVLQNGGFITLPTSKRYVEHHLAGPWNAVHFVKNVASSATAFESLVKFVAKDLGKNEAEAKALLNGLVELSNDNIDNWAKVTPSNVVKSVSKFIFTPDLEALSSISNETPDAVLKVMGTRAWNKYFADLGKALKFVSDAMSAAGHAPQKIVIGGGIGEACSRYDETLQAFAIDEVQHSADLPLRTVGFSYLSGEARESAVTLRDIQQLNNEQ